MKTAITTCCFALCFLPLFSQSEEISTTPKEECTQALMVADQMPLYPGCDESLSEAERIKCTDQQMKVFFHDNFSLPAEATRKAISGTAIVDFLVQKDGSIASVNLDGETGYGIEEEILRVLRLMPNFIPAQHEGKTECVFMHLEMPFKPNTPVFESEKPVSMVVSEMPYYYHPDCQGLSGREKRICAEMKMLEFVYKNIKYPMEARKLGIEGRVVITFIVNTEGHLEDVKVATDIGYGCGEEAMRVVKLMADWIPGYQNGMPRAVLFKLPIPFKLN